MNIERLTKNPALKNAMTAGQLAERAVTEEQEARVKELIAEAEAILGGGQDRDEVILRIAKRVLHLETLETRRMDRLDFQEQAVWGIKEALEQAYEMGRASAGAAKPE